MSESVSCCCTGPPAGETLCPCALRSQALMSLNGRWIKPMEAYESVQPYGEMMKAFAETYKDFIQDD